MNNLTNIQGFVPIGENTDSKLNFTVSESPLHCSVAGKSYDVGTHKILVRDDNHRQLAIVGRGYVTVQNSDLFSAIDDEVIRHFPGDIMVRDKIAHGGRTSMREYVVKDMKATVEGDSNAAVVYRVIAVNGFGWSKIQVLSGAIDFFCLNGMVTGDVSAQYTRKHTRYVSLPNFQKVIAASADAFETYTNRFSDWSGIKITDSQVSDFLSSKKFFTDSLAEKIFGQYQMEKNKRGANLWALYSALTYYATHTDDARFALRDTGGDHEAETLMRRSISVLKMTGSPKFRAMESQGVH